MIVCSFYSPALQYKLAAKRFKLQLKQIPTCSNNYIYNEKTLFHILDEHYPNLINIFEKEKRSRGYIFWAWKPIIIFDALLKISMNETLLYADIGCNLVYQDQELVWKDLLKISKSVDFVTSHSRGHGYKMYGDCEYTWTKPEIFYDLRLNRTDQVSPQFQATWIMMNKSQNTLNFISEWIFRCTKNNLELVRPYIEIKKRGKLIESKNDQAVFSCLIKKYKKNAYVAQLDHMNAISAARNLSFFINRNNNKIIYFIIILEKVLVRLTNSLFFR
jgi:hypothetical protein